MRHAVIFRKSMILLSITKIILCVSFKSNRALYLTINNACRIVNNRKNKG